MSDGQAAGSNQMRAPQGSQGRPRASTADEVRNDIRNELINELEVEQDKAKKEAEAAALPKNLYKYKDAWLEDTKAFEKAIQRNRDQSIVLVAPQFELFEKIDFEDFIRESMLPAATEFAERASSLRASSASSVASRKSTTATTTSMSVASSKTSSPPALRGRGSCCCCP